MIFALKFVEVRFAYEIVHEFGRVEFPGGQGKHRSIFNRI